MVLFVSDMHFGRGTRAEARASEAALISCLRSYASRVQHLYLVGDVFEEYIEYRRLIPKGWVRFMALLAEWTDNQIPVTYIVGNHDPWHQDYFQQELGVQVVSDYVIATASTEALYIRHGDGITTHTRMYRYLKPLLRHPVPVWLYRSLLPADLGLSIATWVNKRLPNHGQDMETIRSLRAHARHILQETSASVVVMGHSHLAELLAWPEGLYLNTGSWHEERLFGALDATGVYLLQWDANQAIVVDKHSIPRTGKDV